VDDLGKTSSVCSSKMVHLGDVSVYVCLHNGAAITQEGSAWKNCTGALRSKNSDWSRRAASLQRIDLSATRPKARVCAYFLNDLSAYYYWVSRVPLHNRVRAMPIGHREDSTDETMTQKSATTFSRCSNASGCVAYPDLGEPAKLSRGNPGPTCFACEERRV
jgi:hypothetical protein